VSAWSAIEVGQLANNDKARLLTAVGVVEKHLAAVKGRMAAG
jgi:hypothetical protein